MNAALAADDPRFAAGAQRTGAAANDEECYSAPSSAAASGNANTRPKSPPYLASEWRDNGTVVTSDKHGNQTGPLSRLHALRGTKASCLALTLRSKTARVEHPSGMPHTDVPMSREARRAGATEDNRIQSLFDNGHEKTYKYDDQGNRAIKRGPQGETVYVNQFFTSRPGANGTKHIYAGTTRIASKLMRQNAPNANPAGKTPFEKDLYFYHPDHLGTSNYITDLNAKLYEHLEYFPFGEAWVEENSNTQRTPYLFTAKELDEETGLYYFGARYYDPRTSVWQSGDPILEKYLPSGNRDRDQNLPGMGGVFNSLNLGLYTYAHQNPLKNIDPNGEFTDPLEINVLRSHTSGIHRPQSSSFGMVRNGNTRPHHGLDLRATIGTNAFASGPGVVEDIRRNDPGPSTYGRYIIYRFTYQYTFKNFLVDFFTLRWGRVIQGIKDHGTEMRARLSHLDSIDPNLGRGSAVEEGQVLGATGRSGIGLNGIGPGEEHLHFELIRGNRMRGGREGLADRYNPAGFLRNLKTDPVDNRSNNPDEWQ